MSLYVGLPLPPVEMRADIAPSCASWLTLPCVFVLPERGGFFEKFKTQVNTAAAVVMYIDYIHITARVRLGELRQYCPCTHLNRLLPRHIHPCSVATSSNLPMAAKSPCTSASSLPQNTKFELCTFFFFLNLRHVRARGGPPWLSREHTKYACCMYSSSLTVHVRAGIPTCAFHIFRPTLLCCAQLELFFSASNV